MAYYRRYRAWFYLLRHYHPMRAFWLMLGYALVAYVLIALAFGVAGAP